MAEQEINSLLRAMVIRNLITYLKKHNFADTDIVVRIYEEILKGIESSTEFHEKPFFSDDDGGKCLIAEFAEENRDLYVQVRSWDESKKHEAFHKLFPDDDDVVISVRREE